MKKIIFIVIMAFAINAHAADLKIGYVDLNSALNASEPGKRAVQALEEMVKMKQTVIDQKEAEIKILNESLKKQANILTPQAMREKQEERDKLARDYQRMIKDSQEEIQKKQAALMNDIIKKLRKLVDVIGKEEVDMIIFEKSESGMLYGPEKADLTEKLINRFNEVTTTGAGN